MTTAKKEIQHLLPDTKFTCFVIPALFSADECAQLLTGEIKNSFQKAVANYPVYYRNNDRFVIDDDALAQQLFEKVKAYLPVRLNNGRWEKTSQVCKTWKALSKTSQVCKTCEV